MTAAELIKALSRLDPAVEVEMVTWNPGWGDFDSYHEAIAIVEVLPGPNKYSDKPVIR